MQAIYCFRISPLREISESLPSAAVPKAASLIAESGLTLRHTEDFRKRHDFADWVSRSRTSASDIATLESILRAATPSQKQTFAIEADATSVTSFTDTKTLFHAVKSSTASLE